MATNSVTSVKIVGTTTDSASTFEVQYPSMVQKSSIPLSGYFSIVCYNLDGVTYNTTADISYAANLITIQSSIVTACPLYRDTFDIWDGPNYSYYVDGRDLMIRFTQIVGSVP
jgi:hypothetical protein